MQPYYRQFQLDHAEDIRTAEQFRLAAELRSDQSVATALKSRLAKALISAGERLQADESETMRDIGYVR
ncbi:MAG: hypothetical protein AAF125_23260 [Chloroflexota bacterium]